MIEKEEPAPRQFFSILSSGLILAGLMAFLFGYVLKVWPQMETRLTLAEAFQCYLPLFPSACAELISNHGGIAPERMLNYQIVFASPLLVLVGLWIFILWQYEMRTKPRVIHNGLTVGTMKHLLAAAKREQKMSRYPDVPGLHLFGGWRLSLNRETLHFNIVGSTGGGKTILMTRLIHSAIERNDKAIIFDQKGDYTTAVPPNMVHGQAHKPILLAPQDLRSAVWDIAADLQVEQEAIELAARLVPEEHHANKFFSDTARAILAACIVKLMDTKPKQWTWSDVLEETRRDNDTLWATTIKYSRGTSRFMEADFRQVMSTLSSLEARMGMLNMLAAAWPSYDGRDRFSIREFLKDTTKFGSVIVRHDGQFSALSDAWISSLFAIAMNTIKDSKTLDDNPLRRIWMFLDEWAQLPKIDQFQTFITVGRTKGVCVVMGLQDTAQISQKYGDDATKTIMASVGTTLIVHVNHGDTALSLERMFGKTSYSEWKQKPYGMGSSMQWVDQRYEEAPFKAPEFSQLLFVDKEGVRTLVSGLGDSLYKVLVPHDQKYATKYREGAVPAPWTTVFKVNGTLQDDADIQAYMENVKRRNKSGRATG